MWLKVLVPAGVVAAAAPIVVQSVNGKRATTADAAQAPKLVRPSQLSIYDPCCCHRKPEPVKLSPTRVAIQEHIGAVRVAIVTNVVPPLDHFADLLNEAVKLEALKKEDAGVARVLVISVCFMSGMLLNIRRGWISRLYYGSLFGTLGAAALYPEEAKSYAKGAYTIAKYYTIVGFNKAKEELSDQIAKTEPKGGPSSTKSNSEQINESVKTKVSGEAIAPPVGSKILPSKLTDFGQSNPKDQDMYSTRS